MRNPLLATTNRTRFFHYYGTPFATRLDPRVYSLVAKCAAKYADGHASLLVNNWFHRFLDDGLELWQIRKARASLGGKRQARIATTYTLPDVPQIKAEMRGWRIRHWEQMQLTQEELVDAILVWYMAAGGKDRRLFKPDKLVRFDKLTSEKLPWPMTWKEAEYWAYNRNDPRYAQPTIADLNLDTGEMVRQTTVEPTRLEPHPQPQPVAQAPITRPDDHPPTTRPNGFASLVDALNAKVPQGV